MVKRWSIDDLKACNGADVTALYVNHEEVIDALQTLIDQLTHNNEWRNGAVMAYNAISCSKTDATVK